MKIKVNCQSTFLPLIQSIKVNYSSLNSYPISNPLSENTVSKHSADR